MKIMVKDIDITVPENVKVKFHSPIGDGVAIWMGEIPKKNTFYDVEIEIPDLLTWGINVLPSTAERFRLLVEGDNVYVSGRINSLEGNLYYFEVLDDILLLEVIGEPLVLKGFVNARVKNIQLYDTKI